MLRSGPIRARQFRLGLLTTIVLLVSVSVAHPAFAETIQPTTCGPGQTATTQNGFSVCAFLTTPGNSSTPTTQPPGHGHPGTPPSTTTYTTPNGCISNWYNASSALGQALGGATMTATCKGSSAEGNLSYYGTTGHQGNTCTVIGGINGVLVCSVIVTYTPGTSPIPPPATPIPTTQSGIPTLDLQALANVQIAAPTIGEMAPNKTMNPQQPWTFTNYPTQVSIVPSSLPATKTGTASDSSSATVGTTCTSSSPVTPPSTTDDLQDANPCHHADC